MGCGSNSDAAKAATLQEQQRQASIKQGVAQIDNQFSGFTPEFYKKRQDAYTAFAAPQLAQQYQLQQKGLQNRLANQGLMKSTAANTLQDSLKQALATKQQEIANTGLQQSQDLQRQVTDSKSNLLGQLQVASDPSSVATNAASVAGQYQAPSALPAFGNAFQDWVNNFNLSRQVSGQQQINNAFAQGYKLPSLGGLPGNG